MTEPVFALAGLALGLLVAGLWLRGRARELAARIAEFLDTAAGPPSRGG